MADCSSFGQSPHINITLSKGVNLRSPLGLEIIAVRGLLLARVTGFHDQIAILEGAGANPEIVAVLYTAMSSSLDAAHCVISRSSKTTTDPLVSSGAIDFGGLDISDASTVLAKSFSSSLAPIGFLRGRCPREAVTGEPWGFLEKIGEH